MKKETENQLKDPQGRSVIGICTGCLERDGMSEEAQADYLRRLRQRFAEFDFETYSCLRLCPENRITLEIPRAEADPQLAMARSVKFEDVAELIERLTAESPESRNTKGENHE